MTDGAILRTLEFHHKARAFGQCDTWRSRTVLERGILSRVVFTLV